MTKNNVTRDAENVWKLGLIFKEPSDHKTSQEVFLDFLALIGNDSFCQRRDRSERTPCRTGRACLSLPLRRALRGPSFRTRPRSFSPFFGFCPFFRAPKKPEKIQKKRPTGRPPFGTTVRAEPGGDVRRGKLSGFGKESA